MCGEAAADLRMVPILMAFGLQTFSVGAASVPEVRRHIAAWSLADAQEAAKHALTLPDAKSVENFLSEGMRSKA
jgi:phosphotransferase system enzyme I (PtsI)